MPGLSELSPAAQVGERVDCALYVGVSLTVNPPYPVSSVGLLPSGLSPFLCTTNIGILVPSFDGYHTWRTSIASASMETPGFHHTVRSAPELPTR